MKRIVLILLFFFALSNLAFSEAQWELAYSDRSGEYYLETKTISPRKDGDELYAIVWSKYVPSVYFKNAQVEKTNDKSIYKIDQVLSNYEIHPNISKRNYRVLTRILLAENGEVLEVEDTISDYRHFNQNSAIAALIDKAIVITIKETQYNSSLAIGKI